MNRRTLGLLRKMPAAVVIACAVMTAACGPSTSAVSPTPTADPSSVAADMDCARALEPLASGINDVWVATGEGVTFEDYNVAMLKLISIRDRADRLANLTDNCVAYRADLLAAHDLFDRAWSLWSACRADGSCADGAGPGSTVTLCNDELATCLPVADIEYRLLVLWDRVDEPMEDAGSHFSFDPPGL